MGLGVSPILALFQNPVKVPFGVNKPDNRHACAMRPVCNEVGFEAANRPNPHAGVVSLANLARRTHERHVRQFGIRLFDGIPKPLRGP